MQDRPVLTGLLALVVVGAVTGAILAFGTLMATRTLGISGGDSGQTTAAEDDQASMYVPEPQPTDEESGPQVTLLPWEEESASESPDESEEPKAKGKAITLRASQNSVAPMQQIDLSGDYPSGEGAIVLVERLVDGTWTDFAGITASVSGGSFSTYVQTGQIGVNKFRVTDTDTGKSSNVVKINVG